MSQKVRVAVIGAGLLGRRHLQSLNLCKNDIKVSVVDLSKVSLEQAENDLLNTRLAGLVEYHQNIEELDENLDLVIVATTAKGRLEVLQALIKKGVKRILLEKVAFNSVYDIGQAKDLIQGEGLGLWVNCPRRLYPIYKDLKTRLQGRKITNFSISGSDYGLACNGIHYIDLFSYIADCDEYSFDLSRVSEIVESKRNGYLEYFGELAGEFSNGSKFELNCISCNGSAQYTIKIFFAGGSVDIDEVSGVLTIDIDGDTEVIKFRLPYQSELTGPLLDEIIDTGTCELTGFVESMRIHTPFIKMAYDEYAKVYGFNEKMYAPIT